MEFLKKIILLIESFLTWCMAVIFKHEFDKKIYRFNFPEIWYSPWNKDNTFIKVYKEISSNTLISKRKLYDIFCIGRQLNRLGGNYLEVGSLQGGSAGLLATTFTGTEIVLWDNWGEPVEHDDYFVEKVYSEKDDLNKTRSLLLQVAPRVLDSCTFVNRLFPCNEVISAWSRKFSLVHFDIYDKEAFELGMVFILNIANTRVEIVI
jgi:hypothetical protein